MKCLSRSSFVNASRSRSTCCAALVWKTRWVERAARLRCEGAIRGDMSASASILGVVLSEPTFGAEPTEKLLETPDERAAEEARVCSGCGGPHRLLAVRLAVWLAVWLMVLLSALLEECWRRRMPRRGMAEATRQPECDVRRDVAVRAAAE